MADPLRYHDVPPIDRKEAETRLAPGSSEGLCHALISLAYHDPDGQWVEKKCYAFIRRRDKEIQATAALDLEHLARIHSKLDKQRVISTLREMLSDPELAGRAQDALDDIETFLGSK